VTEDQLTTAFGRHLVRAERYLPIGRAVTVVLALSAFDGLDLWSERTAAIALNPSVARNERAMPPTITTSSLRPVFKPGPQAAPPPLPAAGALTLPAAPDGWL
jgi:hypothetical protein